MRRMKKIGLSLLALVLLFCSVYGLNYYSLYGSWPTVKELSTEWQRDLKKLQGFQSSSQKLFVSNDTLKRVEAMTPLLNNENQLVRRLKKTLISRQAKITLYYKSAKKPSNQYAQTIYNRAIAPSSEGDAGDYLQYHVSKVTMTSSYFEYDHHYYTTLVYQTRYRSTAAQEQAVSKKVKTILQAVKGQSTQAKIRYINDYLINHVTYDASDPDCYSAYGALIKGRAVCQGYTLAMYRLLTECGVDNRMITGTGITSKGREAHSWNIIKVGSLYYDHDVTWNDAGVRNLYYLRGSRTFDKNHVSDAAFTATTFTKAYPVSTDAYQ